MQLLLNFVRSKLTRPEQKKKIIIIIIVNKINVLKKALSRPQKLIQEKLGSQIRRKARIKNGQINT